MKKKEFERISAETKSELSKENKKKISLYAVLDVGYDPVNSEHDFMKVVCEKYGVKLEDVCSKGKGKRSIVDIRYIICYFMIEYFRMTQEDVAHVVSRGDRSSISIGLKRTEQYCLVDPIFKAKFLFAKNLAERSGFVKRVKKTKKE